MLELATLNPNRTLQLPAEVAKRFQPSDRFVVWLDGDMLHLKRITRSPLKAVEEAPADQPLSLDEIDDLVHKVRRQRKRQKSK